MSCPHLAFTRKISVEDMSRRQQVGFTVSVLKELCFCQIVCDTFGMKISKILHFTVP